MAEIIIKISPKTAPAKLRKFETKLSGNMDVAFKKIGVVLEGQVKENLSGESHTKFPGTSNPYPGVVHGTLRASVISKLRKISQGPQLIVGPGGFASNYAMYPVPDNTRMTGITKHYLFDALQQKADSIIDILHGSIMIPLR